MSRHKKPKHEVEHESHTLESKFAHLGAIEVVPAPENKSVNSTDSKFAHLGAYQVRAGDAE